MSVRCMPTCPHSWLVGKGKGGGIVRDMITCWMCLYFSMSVMKERREEGGRKEERKEGIFLKGDFDTKRYEGPL